MKRSEMLKILEERLVLMRGVVDDFYVYPPVEMMAERLLQTLEDHGMQPPIDYLDKAVWEDE